MTVSEAHSAEGSDVLVPVAPLISQIPAEGDGFPTQELADHWRLRGCGIACLRMVLTTYEIDHGSYWSLINEGLDAGAYCDRGWIHHGLVDMASRREVAGWARRNRSTTQLRDELITGHLVIGSVAVCFRGGQQRPDAPNEVYSPGGHLVVVTGVRMTGNGDPTEFRVHHPSATRVNNLSDHWVPHDEFAASFSGSYMAFANPS